MASGLVYSSLFLQHDTGQHPENSRRLSGTHAHFEETGLWERFSLIEPRAASVEELCRNHDRKQVDYVRSLATAGGGHADPDTVISEGSYAAASHAVGGICDALDKVVEGELENALCLVRPPGHHATPKKPMGFCLFNNVALAALHLREQHGYQRIAIVDFDVHHGNGTQDAFYTDAGVLFFSMHRSPFYPGTGDERERGNGKGAGYTINIPLAGNTRAEEYLELFNRVLAGPITDYGPDFILVSAGFDAYRYDPIGAFCLDEEHYRELTLRLRELAHRCCGGRLLSTLEGGYHLDHLPGLIAAHATELL